MSKCAHGKRRERCKECGGSSICEHGKIKYNCKEKYNDVNFCHTSRFIKNIS